MYLDSLPMISGATGRGKPGLGGKLGYKGLHLRVYRVKQDRSIGAHAPSSLVFDIGGNYDLFTCMAALNDSAFGPNRRPAATFQVLADGVVAATASNVHGGAPVSLIANIQGVRRLELRVPSAGLEPDNCHSVWLNPQVNTWPTAGLLDPIGQVRIHRPQSPIVADRCVVVMSSPGYARWLDIFLNSLRENGNCADAAVIVFRVDADSETDAVIAAHGAHTVPCTSLVPRSSTIRPAVFAVGAAARYNSAIIAETDMIVLQDISALWSAIAVCADPMLFVAREQHRDTPYRLDEFFWPIFLGTPEELDRFGVTERERAYDLQISGGLIAGSAEAVAGLDAAMRQFLPYSRRWVQSRRDVPAREMFLINLAMARLNNAVRIKPSYNTQLFNGVEKQISGAPTPQFEANGEPVKVLHFSVRKDSYAAVRFKYWRCGNYNRKLTAGLDEIRRAPLESLREADFVADIIRQTGLQEMLIAHAEQTYSEEIAWMNTGPGLFQMPMQLARALVWLSDRSIRSYAEVGVYYGWTFAFVTAYLNRFGSLERILAIDTENRFEAFGYLRELYPVEFHCGTSAQHDGQNFDLVFIDGDHSYGAAQTDWLRLGRHARFCMFHDINDALAEQFTRVDSVTKLWDELRARSEYSPIEILDHPINARVMGIGLLCIKTNE